MYEQVVVYLPRKKYYNVSNLSCEKKQNYNQSYQISAQAYWRLHLLQSDADVFTHFNWKLGFCLLLTWIIISLHFFKCSKFHNKLLIVTSVYPNVGLLLLCLATIVVKDGTKEGLIYGLRPKLEDLFSIKIWYEACVQCFISLGVGFGHVLIYSRRNKFRESIHRNCAFTGINNICTTILSNLLFFSILGVIANGICTENIRILCYRRGYTDIISPIFLVYSDGFDLIPQLWIILFFMILFLSALSNMMIYIETITETLSQQFEILQKSVALCVCSFCCICGLFLTTNIGPLIANSMDKYGVSITIFVCSIMEVTGIVWMYGYKHLFKDITFMSRSEINILLKVFYSLVLPLILIVVGLYGIIDFVQSHHNQTWITILGWILAGIALIQLPAWFTESYFQAPERGCKDKMKYICKSEDDWGPVDPFHYVDWLHKKNKKKYMCVYEKNKKRYSFDTNDIVINNLAYENEYVYV